MTPKMIMPLSMFEATNENGETIIDYRKLFELFRPLPEYIKLDHLSDRYVYRMAYADWFSKKAIGSKLTETYKLNQEYDAWLSFEQWLLEHKQSLEADNED